MGHSSLLVLGLILNIAHCLEIVGEGQDLEITRRITGVLGEDVYFRCSYLGQNKIINSQWKRQIESTVKSRRLAGFFSDEPFSNDADISIPHSSTNLTVKMRVSSVKSEGEYTCEFESLEEIIMDTIKLTVIAHPEFQVQVSSENINGTHYQKVLCSAVGGRPTPQISWLINRVTPMDHNFTMDMSETHHPNGTSTLISILHLPTHLLDDDTVTCVANHPTISDPKLTTVRVETYVRPNVSIKTEMVQQGENEFWEVLCISSGGRPDAEISLALDNDEELQRKDSTGLNTQIRSFLLPALLYEGHNITCVFDHPKFMHKVMRVVTLPSFYLSGVQILSWGKGNSSNGKEGADYVELQEGQSEDFIKLEVTGNVPHYNLICKKDDKPLPDDVEVHDSSLKIKRPVGYQHAGLYECVASYHHYQASLLFNVTVKPLVLQPVPPTIRVDLQMEGGYSLIECLAADAFPAANISWLLPEGVSRVAWFNFTSHNGSHSVRGVLVLPVCLPEELTAVCVINHPVFEKPENRSITLSHCAPLNITVNSRSEWRDGEAHTQVNCSVISTSPSPTVTWRGGSIGRISHQKNTEVLPGGLISTHSSVNFMSALYSGQSLACVVEHPSLEVPKIRTIKINPWKPELSVFLEREQSSPFWQAVCDYRGEGVTANLAWVLPEKAEDKTSLLSENEGPRLIYQFPLALHEGQNLTCICQFENGLTQQRTIYVPRYYISSVRVVNRTTLLKIRYGGGPIIYRLTLQENQLNQRIILRVEGNVPEYNLICLRPDGLFVKMEGAAMVFQSEVTELHQGLYTCQASFYHHTAMIKIQVEVKNKEKLFRLVIMVSVSFALAICLMLLVIFWVCCGRNRTENKKPKCLSALTSLLPQYGSPKLKKQATVVNESRENNRLVNYSIVIDVKSTV